MENLRLKKYEKGVGKKKGRTGNGTKNKRTQ